MNEYAIQLPALFRTYKVPGEDPIEHRGFYPIHALPNSLRRDLDVIFDSESLEGPARERQIAEVKAKIRAEIEKKSIRRTADDRLILSFESDQEILFEQGREWKISFLDTNVDRAGERNPSRWTVRMNASLDQVLQGIPRPAQLLHSELIMKKALEETDEICALHQPVSYTHLTLPTSDLV